ncbi:MAG: hypothetical protein F7C07_08450 [Desulfurococcales archaeon]|nr:hypothetical protein [Desulfurococcales archaeon]
MMSNIEKKKRLSVMGGDERLGLLRVHQGVDPIGYLVQTDPWLPLHKEES